MQSTAKHRKNHVRLAQNLHFCNPSAIQFSLCMQFCQTMYVAAVLHKHCMCSSEIWFLFLTASAVLPFTPRASRSREKIKILFQDTATHKKFFFLLLTNVSRNKLTYCILTHRHTKNSKSKKSLSLIGKLSVNKVTRCDLVLIIDFWVSNKLFWRRGREGFCTQFCS